MMWKPLNNSTHALGHDEAIQKRFYHRHKQLFTSVVMPVILATTLLLIATHLSNTWKFWSALGVILALDVFNVYFSRRQRPIKTPFGTFDSRSDIFDTFRWCVNLPFDVFMLWALGLDFVCASFSWLLLTFGAMTEIFSLKNRLITVSVALACFITMTQVFEATAATKVYVLTCYIGVIFILFRFERWLFDEMESYYESEQQNVRIAAEGMLLQRQAVIGNQARTICHEINNMLSIMQLSVGRLRPSGDGAEEERKTSVKRMERALNTLTRLSQVVLKDVGQDHQTQRRYAVEELILDLEVLLDRQFKAMDGLEFTMSLPKKKQATGHAILESTGTTYLILHNLVKNAAEAVTAPGMKSGKVELTLELTANDLVLSIADNGPGFSQVVWNDVVGGKRGNVTSGKLDGNGLGLRFTLDQTRLNGMALTMETREGKGTTFRLTAPLVAAESDEEAA